jgi:hypothetical protein
MERTILWGAAMPTIAKLGAIQIRMFADDHHPPHFHIWTPDGEALVSIKDLAVLRGHIRKRDLGLVLTWAEHNMSLLMSEWDRLNG